MAIFLTIISGTFVFVLGQIILKLLIEPVQEARKGISKIKVDHTRYGHIIHNANSFDDNTVNLVFDAYRVHAGQLVANTELIPFYSISSKIFGLPSRENVKKATTNLIALSSWMRFESEVQIGNILKNSQELETNLGFHLRSEDRISDETIREPTKRKS